MKHLASVLLLLLAACDPGDVVLLAPETSGGAPTLSIHAVIDTPYAALAESLGWSAGVPGAQVRVHLMSEPYDSNYWHVATADSGGHASFSGLGGLYEVEVTRTLSSAEIARAGGGARVLAGGRRLYAPTSAATDVTMAPDQRGALVFSEFGESEPDYLKTGGTEYADAKYFEVYNNSDTTIYLDGKYWGIGWDLNDNFPYWPCAQTEPVRNDPQGIWADRIFRFPGRGTDYPLLPGSIALIAKSAIDHRQLYPFVYDLSHADFEWGPPITADNPDVPNLSDIGLRPMVVNWPWYTQPQFLSEPVDLATLPRYLDPYSGHTWARIPRAIILDAVVGTSEVPAGVPVTDAPCLEATHRYFERLPGPATALTDFEQGVSFQRRVATVLPDGRKILQDTNTSMFDFERALRTPGWIP